MEDLIFNELSTKPYPEDFNGLNQRVLNLLSLCKAANSNYGLKKLRFTNYLHEINLKENLTFQNYLDDSNTPKIAKDLLLSIYRYPFIEDEDEEAIVAYVSSSFKYENIRCSGLAGAFIYKTLAASILSESKWDVTSINVNITNEEVTLCDIVYHISKTEHLNNEDIKRWFRNKCLSNIRTTADLDRAYPKHVFEDKAFNDLMDWKEQNPLLYERLHVLLQDIVANPFTGGIGKTEALKGKGAQASKRLNDEHRIVYSLAEGVITVHSCKGHYDD